GGVDEDRDRRDVGDAARALRASEAEHQLLGQLRALRLQRQRGVHLGELVGLAVLVGVKLDEQRVRLDARRIERDRPPQVLLGGGRILAVDLRQRQPHAYVVAVVLLVGQRQQLLERGQRRFGLAAGQRQLAGEKQDR